MSTDNDNADFLASALINDDVRGATAREEHSTPLASEIDSPDDVTANGYATTQIPSLPTTNFFASVTPEAHATANDASIMPQNTASWSTNFIGPAVIPARSASAPSSGKVSKGKNRVNGNLEPKKRQKPGTGELIRPCDPEFGFSRDDAQKRHILNCKHELCKKEAVFIRLQDAWRKEKKGKLNKEQLAQDLQALDYYQQALQQQHAPPGNGKQPSPSTLQPPMAPPQLKQAPRSLEPAHPWSGALHDQPGPFQQNHWPPTAASGQVPFLAEPTDGPANFPGSYTAPQSHGLRYSVLSYYPQAPTGTAPYVQLNYAPSGYNRSDGGGSDNVHYYFSQMGRNGFD